ncbi:MAG TPA: radical SAM protein [Euryarchaeota archaeon]|nr:radical SAM protein [Euryarchaeota archaeon]
MRKTNNNLFTGELSKGCRQCMKGEKLVLFISGICNMECIYCPLSEERRDRNLIWANERAVTNFREVLQEAEAMHAGGAGITGGDPLLSLSKTLEYTEALKKEFGTDFHLHLYTAQPVNEQIIKKLYMAGVDEIRFHITDKNINSIWNTIEAASKVYSSFGVEIPAVPGKAEKIKEIALRINSLGGFLNLNELEFSHTNAEKLLSEGYNLNGEESYAAEGSEEAALEVLNFAEENSLRVHFCTSEFKDSVQLKNRLLRTALQNVKDYEEVIEDGLLLKGVIISMKGSYIELISYLREKFDIPENLITFDEEKGRIETTREIVEALSKIYRNPNLKYYIVEEYPTSNRLETELIPL